MTDDMVIEQEVKTMNRLVDWCLNNNNGPYSPERIRQLITDWSRVSGDIIPKKILTDTLERMEITFQGRMKYGKRNEMVGSQRKTR
jgi:hypothetical protein